MPDVETRFGHDRWGRVSKPAGDAPAGAEFNTRSPRPGQVALRHDPARTPALRGGRSPPGIAAAKPDANTNENTNAKPNATEA